MGASSPAGILHSAHLRTRNGLVSQIWGDILDISSIRELPHILADLGVPAEVGTIINELELECSASGDFAR